MSRSKEAAIKRAHAFLSWDSEGVESSALSRATVIEDPKCPWNQRWYTAEQANAEQLTTRRRFCEAKGYHRMAANHWSENYPDFPKPKGILSDLKQVNAYLYSARELVEWFDHAVASGRLHGPMSRRK